MFHRNREENNMNKITKIHTDSAPAAVGPVFSGNRYRRHALHLRSDRTGSGDGRNRRRRHQGSGRAGDEEPAAVLAEAGTSQENVIKTTCFLKDMGDFGTFNEVYGAFFTEKPARSCVAVKTLPKDVLCEVEVIAVL